MVDQWFGSFVVYLASHLAEGMLFGLAFWSAKRIVIRKK